MCVGAYYGEHCENKCNDSLNCSGNGMCIHNGKCACNEGFQGDSCEEIITLDIDVNIVYVILLLVVLTVQLYLFYKQTVSLMKRDDCVEETSFC